MDVHAKKHPAESQSDVFAIGLQQMIICNRLISDLLERLID